MYIANPNALENVLRAEGKYPRREANLSPYIQWILNKQNFAVPLPFKYVPYAIMQVHSCTCSIIHVE